MTGVSLPVLLPHPAAPCSSGCIEIRIRYVCYRNVKSAIWAVKTSRLHPTMVSRRRAEIRVPSVRRPTKRNKFAALVRTVCYLRFSLQSPSFVGNSCFTHATETTYKRPAQANRYTNKSHKSLCVSAPTTFQANAPKRSKTAKHRPLTHFQALSRAWIDKRGLHSTARESTCRASERRTSVAER